MKVLFAASPARSLGVFASTRPPTVGEELWNAVSSFETQKAIANTAQQRSNRVTPRQLMYGGRPQDELYLIKTARFLRQELPIRVAHRISQFQDLPFIVGCNPQISAVHWRYLRSFQQLNKFKAIRNFEDTQEFGSMIKELLDDHRGVVTSIARGFDESKRYINPNHMHRFLDHLLSSRLGIRMLCEHQISMKEDRPGYVGIIHLNMHLLSVIQRSADFARQICLHQYNIAPNVIIDGHTGASFAYIPAPLEYMLQELLKNAMRATVEFHKGISLPPIRVTICNNPIDFTIRIADRGGGMSEDELAHLLEYSSTTANEANFGGTADTNDDTDVFSRITSPPHSGPAAGPMAGYGYGFPISRCYAKYLGGKLQLVSMNNTGSDAFLRLKHFDVQPDSFYI